MAIKVQLPPVPVIREAANGNDTAAVSGGTVKEALADLVRQFPALEPKLFDGGSLRPHIIVTVNDEDIRYLDDLDTPVRDGESVVAIVPAVAGG